VYGIDLLAAALAYYILQTLLVRADGQTSRLRAALGTDIKGKVSPPPYVLGIALTFADRWIGVAVYVAVALIWLCPTVASSANSRQRPSPRNPMSPSDHAHRSGVRIPPAEAHRGSTWPPGRPAVTAGRAGSPTARDDHRSSRTRQFAAPFGSGSDSRSTGCGREPADQSGSDSPPPPWCPSTTAPVAALTPAHLRPDRPSNTGAARRLADQPWWPKRGAIPETRRIRGPLRTYAERPSHLCTASSESAGMGAADL
jgi:hypothetical protein